MTELIAEGSAAFSDSIIITSVAGGVVLLIAAVVVWKLIPRNLDFANAEH